LRFLEVIIKNVKNILRPFKNEGVLLMQEATGAADVPVPVSDAKMLAVPVPVHPASMQ
jgi:hypothetical protein